MRAAACDERAGLAGEARRLYAMAAAAATGNAATSGTAHGAMARLEEDGGAQAELLETELREAAEPEDRLALRRRLLELAVQRGDATQAKRHAGELLASDPADLAAFLALKQVYTAEAAWLALAELLAGRAATLADASERTERAALFYQLGRLRADRLGDAAGAARAFERAMVADPDHPAALEALADAAYDAGDLPRARSLYTRLTPDHCSHAPEVIAVRIGEAAESMGDDAAALAAFAQACELAPGSRAALTALGRVAQRTGDLARAITAGTGLLDLIAPDDVRALVSARLQLGELCLRAGDARAALGHLEAVIGEDPTSTAALGLLATAYGEVGEWPQVVRALRALIGMAATPKQRADLLYRLGEVERTRLDSPERAADAYLKAADLDPGHAPTLRRLIDYYWTDGDLDELHEIASDLDAQNGLLHPDTPAETLARALVALGQEGQRDWALRLGHGLGDAAPALAVALADAADRGGDGALPGLAALTLAVCRERGAPDVEEVRRTLDAMAAARPRAGRLGAALSPLGGR
jgi:tetratricopeptide (TPR) repeat protein